MLTSTVFVFRQNNALPERPDVTPLPPDAWLGSHTHKHARTRRASSSPKCGKISRPLGPSGGTSRKREEPRGRRRRRRPRSDRRTGTGPRNSHLFVFFPGLTRSGMNGTEHVRAEAGAGVGMVRRGGGSFRVVDGWSGVAEGRGPRWGWKLPREGRLSLFMIFSEKCWKCVNA